MDRINFVSSSCHLYANAIMNNLKLTDLKKYFRDTSEDSDVDCNAGDIYFSLQYFLNRYRIIISLHKIMQMYQYTLYKVSAR